MKRTTKNMTYSFTISLVILYILFSWGCKDFNAWNWEWWTVLIFSVIYGVVNFVIYIQERK